MQSLKLAAVAVLAVASSSALELPSSVGELGDVVSDIKNNGGVLKDLPLDRAPELPDLGSSVNLPSLSDITGKVNAAVDKPALPDLSSVSAPLDRIKLDKANLASLRSANPAFPSDQDLKTLFPGRDLVKQPPALSELLDKSALQNLKDLALPRPDVAVDSKTARAIRAKFPDFPSFRSIQSRLAKLQGGQRATSVPLSKVHELFPELQSTEKALPSVDAILAKLPNASLDLPDIPTAEELTHLDLSKLALPKLSDVQLPSVPELKNGLPGDVRGELEAADQALSDKLGVSASDALSGLGSRGKLFDGMGRGRNLGASDRIKSALDSIHKRVSTDDIASRLNLSNTDVNERLDSLRSRFASLSDSDLTGVADRLEQLLNDAQGRAASGRKLGGLLEGLNLDSLLSLRPSEVVDRLLNRGSSLGTGSGTAVHASNLGGVLKGREGQQGAVADALDRAGINSLSEREGLGQLDLGKLQDRVNNILQGGGRRLDSRVQSVIDAVRTRTKATGGLDISKIAHKEGASNLFGGLLQGDLPDLRSAADGLRERLDGLDLGAMVDRDGPLDNLSLEGMRGRNLLDTRADRLAKGRAADLKLKGLGDLDLQGAAGRVKAAAEGKVGRKKHAAAQVAGAVGEGKEKAERKVKDKVDAIKGKTEKHVHGKGRH